MPAARHHLFANIPAGGSAHITLSADKASQ